MKTMKTFSRRIAALLLVVTVGITALAPAASAANIQLPSLPKDKCVVDDAGVLSDSTTTELETINAQLSSSCDGAQIGVLTVDYTGSATTEGSVATRLSASELEDVLRDAVEIAASLGMELDFTSPDWLPEETLRGLGLRLIPSCGACLSNMAITPDGTVVPCQSWLGGVTLGNILTDPWEKIWTDPQCAAIRAESAKMEHICQLQTGNRKEAEA